MAQAPATCASPRRPATTASVVVVSYNGRDDLDRCMRSVLADQCDDVEIVVVDNASTDGSADHIEQAFPRVQVLRSPVNGGFGQGNNIGARHARGEYLVFLNPDTMVAPGWLDRLIEALESAPRAGLATAKILLLDDPNRVNTCGNRVHYTGLTLCRGLGAAADAFREIHEVDAVSGAAFAMRRDLFERLGGFDASFFLYMEDTDLAWRARLAGYRCLAVPSSVVYHAYTLRFGPHKTYFQERNRYLMLLKSLRWRTLLALAPALLLAEVLTWGFVLLRERRHLANKARAYAWIVRHWSRVMAARRRTQALRRVDDRDLIGQCGYRIAFEQTGDGLATRMAHAFFDPLFFALRRAALAVIRW